MQPHPSLYLGDDAAEFARQVGHVRFDLAAFPGAGLVADVDAVGRRVLADHEQLARAGRDELLRLAQDRVGPPAGEIASQAGDDAERAAVVAALRDFQVAVVTRRELQLGVLDRAAPLRKQVLRADEVEIGRPRHRRGRVDRAYDLLVLMRARHREHAGEARADGVGLLAHAARDDHAAVLRDRLADRLQAFFLGGVEEAAGVDQHHVGALVIGRHRIALGAQAGQDALAVDQVLRTAERDHAHAGR